MGRQIAIALSQVDEAAFLGFLRSRGDIQLFTGSAPSPPEIWVESFAPELAGHWGYRIWNRQFPWEPVYGRVTSDPYKLGRLGWYYVANYTDAPVIEFLRSDVAQAKYGRLYWAKYFAAPNGLAYDVEAFSAWYDSIVRWIKKNAVGKVKDAGVTWFLPDAWRIHTEITGRK